MIMYVATSLLNFPMVIMTQAIAVSFLVCSVIGIFFGWYPARKTAGINPIDAVRNE